MQQAPETEEEAFNVKSQSHRLNLRLEQTNQLTLNHLFREQEAEENNLPEVQPIFYIHRK